MENLEYFIVKPSIKTFGGIRVTKETEFDVYNDDKTIHQTMKDLKLTTEIKKESEFSGIKSFEDSKLITELPEGQIVIWSEETGYIVPNYVMVRPEEAIEMMNELNNITKPIEEGTKKAKGE